LEIGAGEISNGVAAVHCMAEYPWRVSDFGEQQLSLNSMRSKGVLSALFINYCTPPPLGDTDNNTSSASSTIISPYSNLGGNNALCRRDLQDYHGWDDSWNQSVTDQLVARGKCKSHKWRSEHHYGQAGKLMEYPPCVEWSLIIQCKTIKQ
jgi:hypothetical protein